MRAANQRLSQPEMVSWMQSNHTRQVGRGACHFLPILPLRIGSMTPPRIAGLSRSSLYVLIGEGKLRSVLVAGRRLIPADALREILRGAV